MKKKSLAIFLAGFLTAAILAHYDRLPKYDMDLPPQNVRLYAGDESDDPIAIQENFREHFFMPWQRDEPANMDIIKDITESAWNTAFHDGMGRKYPKDFIWSVVKNADIGNIKSPLDKGIIVRKADLRIFPNPSPMYPPPSHPTFGFPFDGANFSNLNPNTPVLILHVSMDGEYYLVNSYAADAFWVKSDAVRLVSQEEIERYMNAPLVTPALEPLLLPDGEKITIGTLFPVWEGKPKLATKDGWESTSLPYLVNYPISLSRKNIASLAQAMQKNYAWGGIGGEGRDCSQLLQEMFLSFGIYMPRNSNRQSGYFEGIDLSGMDENEKREIIISKGRPFETLLYQKGHIMLYIGTDAKGEPLVYHSIWGIKRYSVFLQEQRYVIGHTIVSDLNLGKSFYNKSLLQKLEKMVFITERKKTPKKNNEQVGM